MAHYLLFLHTSDDPPPADAPAMTEEQMQASWQKIQALETRMKDAGAWVASARLAGSEATTVVRRSGDEVLTTDGPSPSEGAPRRAYIVEAEDLDAALGWARTDRGDGMPIEVRPFRADERDRHRRAAADASAGLPRRVRGGSCRC